MRKIKCCQKQCVVFFIVFLKIHFPVLLEDYILTNAEIVKRLSRSDANQ